MVLTKTKVEVDGKDKVIIMIRDLTDKVRLEQHQLKKEKEAASNSRWVPRSRTLLKAFVRPLFSSVSTS